MLKVAEHVDNESRNMKKMNLKCAELSTLDYKHDQMEKFYDDILCEEERLKQIIFVC